MTKKITKIQALHHSRLEEVIKFILNSVRGHRYNLTNFALFNSYE